jgi:hypothetical protein
MNTPNELRPGEKIFSILLVLFSGFLFFESYKISQFKSLVTSGAMPMFASTLMFVSSIFILINTFSKNKTLKQNSFQVIKYLFPLRFILFVLLIFLYTFVIQYLGFLLASGIFLFISVWSLWEKGPLPAILISLSSIATIYLLFRIVFKVILPIGTFFQ